MHACIDDDWILVFDLYLRVNYHRRRTCTFVEKKKMKWKFEKNMKWKLSVGGCQQKSELILKPL